MMVKKAAAVCDWVGTRVRKLLLAVAANESLFFFAAFLPTLVFASELFKWQQEAVSMFERYIVVPWGMALCLLRLERRDRLGRTLRRMDLNILFVLLMWIIVPFCIRFGMTFNNMSSWHGHCVAYFGLYAMLSEEEDEIRERRLDQACMLFGILSLVMGGALLFCALTGARIDSDWIVHYGTYNEGGYSFGVFNGENLCSGLHYNFTGVMALCCTMFCFAGLSRSRSSLLRLLYLVALVMMMIVIVLTQSRTARYALIISMGLGLYGHIAAVCKARNVVVRHAAGLLAAAVVMVVSYGGAAMLTDAALQHYALVEQGRMVSVVATARAEEEWQAEEELEEALQPKKARAAVDATMSGRTDVWKNLFNYWKANPKLMIIGCGMGNIGSRIVQGTIHEEGGAVSIHNTYLQYLAEYGVIGIGLLGLFFLSVFLPVLRVFFAEGEKRIPGHCAMCMLVIAALMTGMMESWTLGAMTALNAAMLFALAILVPHGNKMKA